MRPIVIIGNPKAGSGLAAEKLREAKRTLWGRKYEYYMPESADALEDLCKNLDPERYEAVAVLGGDGTINRAIRGLTTRAKQIPLYPFPVGTANDLAAELKLKADWNYLEKAIASRSYEKIDLIHVNGIPFATVAGLGIGAMITAELNENRDNSKTLQYALKHLKAPIYSVLTLKAILVRHSKLSQKLRIDSGNLSQNLTTPAIFVCNQGRLGGGLRVADRNDNTDGRFSVLAATSNNLMSLVAQLWLLRKGAIPASFLSFSTSHLTIESINQKPISVFGDGETLTEAAKLKFVVAPKALTVFRGERI